jgi:predicted outer membrane repeat protein
MSFFPWLRTRHSADQAVRRIRRWPRSRRPRLEALEDRVVPSTVWFVNRAATGAKDGQDWADAFTDLQSALQAAQAADQIWVAEGTYTPTSGTDQTVSFVLKDGVGVYGGFAGTETLLSQRDPPDNITRLSGDIGTLGDTSDNSNHVVTCGLVSAGAVLDGFTISGGTAAGASFPLNSGGGMYLDGGLPTLANLIFNSNSAGNDGGGLYVNDGAPTLTNVTFSGNSAGDAGGGLYDNSAGPTLTNVTFSGNSSAFSGSGGGGMYDNSGAPTLTNITFSGNSGAFGGGLFDNNSVLVLNNVTFSNNSATFGGGGGMYNFDSNTPSLTNVTFIANSAAKRGGGMLNTDSSPLLTSVAFSRNTAALFGGGMASSDSNPILANVSFSGNSAPQGGAFYNDSGTPTILSSIVWGNTASTGGAEILDSGGATIVLASDVEGGWSGSGNINADPLFVNAAQDDLHLQSGSPAAGMGAYDFQQIATTTLVTSTPLNATYSSAEQDVLLTATVTPASSVHGSEVNEGSVAFTILGPGNQKIIILNGATVSQGSASVTLNLVILSAGTYQIHAAYVPRPANPNFVASADTSDGSLTVAPASTSTAVTSSGASKVFSSASQVISLAAKVVPSPNTAGGEVNEGTVTFTVVNAANQIVATLSGATVSGGKAGASYDLAGLSAGTYQFHVAYVPAAANPNFLASTDASSGTAPGALVVVAASNIVPVNPVTAIFGPSPNASQNEAFIKGLYRLILGRDADPGGLGYWLNFMAASGDALEAREQLVQQGFWNSYENRAREVNGFYESYLGRDADPQGLAYWTNQLQNGADETAVVAFFLLQQEAAKLDNSDWLTNLYRGALGRTTDTNGLSYWLAQLNSNQLTREQVEQIFVLGSEAAGVAIASFYVDYLQRLPDSQGQAYWVAAISAGKSSYASVAITLLASNEFFSNAGNNVPGSG